MTLLPHIVNGVALGVLFGLLALGFMLIVGVMEVINLAHGSLFALGAYLAVEIISPRWPRLPAWLAPLGTGYLGLPLPIRYGLALVLAPLGVGLLGMGLERLVRRTYGKKAEYGLLLTFGASLVLEEGIRMLWGPGEQHLPVPAEVNGGVEVGGIIYSKYRFFAAAVGIFFMALVWLFLEKTPTGARVKAGAHDGEMVRALGIDIDRLRVLVFALGAGLAAVAGIVLTPIWGLRPHVGVDAVIPAFLIIVLGGVGSFWGAVLAGQLVGITVGLTGGFAAEWSMMSMYLLLIFVLSFRARGLFGKKSALEA